MPAVDVTAEIEIAAAPADVAAVMFDPDRDPEWISAVKNVELIDKALQPGARVKRGASFFGHEINWTTEVQDVHFPHVLTLRIIEGPFSGTVAYQIVRNGAGSRVVIRNKGETDKLGFLPASMIEAPLRSGMQADLARLKAIVEGGPK